MKDKLVQNIRTWFDFELVMTAISVWVGVVAIIIIESRIAHDIGPHLYGDYKIAILVFFCIGQFLVLGTDNVAMKLLPPMLQQNLNGQVKYFVNKVILTVSIVSCLWSTISIIIYYLYHAKYSHLYIQQPFIYYLNFASIWAFAILGLRLLRVMGYTITSIMLYYAYGPLMYIFLLRITPISFDVAIRCSGISYILISFISYIILWNILKKIKSSPFHFSLAVIIDAGNYVIQQLFSLPIIIILLFIAKIIVVSGNKIGILALVFMLIGTINATNMILKNVFMRRISLVINFNKTHVRQLLRNMYVVALLLFILSCFFILYLLFPTIHSVLGSDFIEIDRLIMIALIGAFGSLLVSCDTFYLNFHHYNKYLTSLYILKSILAVILGIILIHYFSIDGAVYAYTLIELVFSIVVFTLKSCALHN